MCFFFIAAIRIIRSLHTFVPYFLPLSLCLSRIVIILDFRAFGSFLFISFSRIRLLCVVGLVIACKARRTNEMTTDGGNVAHTAVTRWRHLLRIVSESVVEQIIHFQLCVCVCVWNKMKRTKEEEKNYQIK